MAAGGYCFFLSAGGRIFVTGTVLFPLKMKTLTLSTPVKDLFMVGPVYAKRLARLNLQTAEDLLHHYPFRYEDYRLFSKIRQLQAKEVVTVVGQIISFENIYTKGGKKFQKIIVADETGEIQVIFFNQPFLKKTLKPGLRISLAGRVEFFNARLSFLNPEYELIKEPKAKLNIRSENFIHTGRLVPIYPETAQVSSRWLRSRIAPLLNHLLPSLKDWLPASIQVKEQLLNLQTALKQIHFPANPAEAKAAKTRLAFDELFLLQLASLRRRHHWQQQKNGPPLKINKLALLKFIQKLPFVLTDDQKQVLREILGDLIKNQPMNRLLQGDVGCGKTVVAAVAAYATYLAGYQSVLMAPTEILANQHYQTFKTLLEPFGLKIKLITSGTSPSKDKKLKNKPEKAVDIFIGTHALLYPHLELKKLGLVIIDEQHRFGVEQRAKLIKKGKNPHLLIMTATPIPRTVALTLYGDLNLSIIKQMPQGRRQVKTWVVPPQKRAAAYNWIRKQIKNLEEGNQAFIVCPLIEPSTVESLKDIKAAKEEFKNLSQKIFPDLRLGLLHGRLKSREKETIINDFRLKKIDILVATPVVEVGIDIPDATIMVVEGADRFGLATLHQLRGRVGRSHKQSYCLLFASQKDKSYQRLKLMETCHQGMKLAEMDLKWRGPGELYGTAQHGFIKFKLASFSDSQLIEKTHQAALGLLEKENYNLKNLPLLHQKLEKVTIKAVEPN